ncbi:MAG: prepilin-type N-terminal cleavage/methylation domain-containing protein [Burkholderiaceae bacterium]|jgi:general secretion pathway protein J|nr:prepilin-type N-terminal cleavage/methylation domain-containing protein [Burkholderiaceae bacterium]
MPAPTRRRGFTLVEVLVALAVLALLAALGWQGLAGMLRARDGSNEALERVQRLNTGIVQWQQDLQAVADVGVVTPLAFNGQTLLLTRRVPGGVAVVAWALRDGRWQRWIGAPQVEVGALQEAWLRAQGLLGNEPGQVTVAERAGEWQLYKYVGGTRTNFQSTGELARAPAGAASGAAAREALPEAVELVLTLDGQRLTRLVALVPGGAGA